MRMTRREFLTQGCGLLLGASLLRILGTAGTPPQAGDRAFPSHSAISPWIVVARNGTPSELLAAALKAYGGVESMVKKGQRVVIKVNMSFYRTPEEAATTNPELVEALVKACLNAGASEVLVLDHTIDNGEMCLDSSGLKEAVERARGKIKLINTQRDYREVKIPRGISLKKTLISKDVLDADVFINVPKVKSHNSSTTTISMKNLMGVVWDRGEFHWLDLHQCIADLSTVVRPDVIILDAHQILMTNGPGGPGEIKEAGEVVVGTDPVALDAYGTLLLERDPETVEYIKVAHAMGLGEIDLSKVGMTYVDAQESLNQTAKPSSTPAPTQTPAPSETTPPESEAPTQPMIPQSETPAKEEEKEAGIPYFILIPAVVVSFLIGLRMRRKGASKEQ